MHNLGYKQVYSIFKNAGHIQGVILGVTLPQPATIPIAGGYGDMTLPPFDILLDICNTFIKRYYIS